MFQSIETKYLGPTNFRGGRIKAQASGKFSRTYSYDHALSVEANHNAAALRLAVELKWAGRWCGGSSQSGNGNVYVNVDNGGNGASFLVNETEA